MISQLWRNSGRNARAAMLAGAVLIGLAFGGTAYFVFRTNEEVLFRDMSERELASLAAELDRMKVAYSVGPDGASLRVERSVAQGVRLKLAGRDVPLHGGVGFELFGQGDFGMTDFAQRVNYQRALQGELARTVMSLAEVRDARVHVALPEDGLFRRQQGKAKASVTLALKPGRALRPAQVFGIQSLVASAVPGVVSHEVTVIDQEGVALTRAAADAVDGTSGPSGRLDLKKELELHLGRKATDVLERAVGAGKAFASVDVSLNLDAVRVTTEDVLPAGGGHSDRSAVGVLVRERTRGEASAVDGKDGAKHPSGQREVEYLAGKRVEQVVVQPGAIRQLQVVAVVNTAHDDVQLAKLERLLGAAVGAATERGDTVLVQSGVAFSVPMPIVQAEVAGLPPRAPSPEAQLTQWGWSQATSLALVGLVVMGSAWGGIRWRRQGRLTAAQRIQSLQRIHRWLGQPSEESVLGAIPPSNPEAKP